MDKIKPILKQHLSELKRQLDLSQPKVGMVLFFHDSGVNALMQKAKLQEQRTIIDNTSEINSWFNEAISLSSIPNSLRDEKQLSRYAKALAKAHQQDGLDLITVCIDIHSASLLSPKGLITELNLIKKTIKALCDKLPTKPALFITFTQLDKIAGFCHSFANADLSKNWGYQFGPYLNEASLIQQQNERFNRLVEELHESLIDKLHHSDDKLSRYLIREFPLQMESLTNMIRACVKHLSSSATNMSGVYFTSAKQGNHANDRLSKHITQAFSLTPIDKIPQSSLNKAFFIDGWLQAIINHKNLLHTPSRKQSLKPYFVSGAASLALSTLVIGLYVHHSTSLLNNAHQQLVSTLGPSSQTQDLTEVLEGLFKASQSADEATNALSFPMVKTFSENAKKQYQDGLSSVLLPSLKEQIEQSLQSRKGPLETYSALKAYLMLGDSRVTNADYLYHWLENNWQPTLTPSQLKRSKHLLSDALKEPFQPLDVNQQLIESTRSFLLALPNDYLLFSLAKPYLPSKFTAYQVEGFSLPLSKIPEIYSRENYTETYNTTLAKVAATLRKESFVLGFKSEQSILRQLRDNYLKNYLVFWQNFVKHSHAQTFDSYINGQRLFIELSKEGNALEQLTSFVQSQTAPFSESKEGSETLFNKIVANQFSSLQLLTPYQLQLVRSEFMSLAKYYANFQQMNDNGQSAYQFAKQRFSHKNGSDPLSRLYELASELPQPMQTWITAINDNSWFLILLNTERYINETWNQHVYQLYHLKLKGKFPFKQDSNIEVSLTEFANFFGPNGILATFFNQTLAPFIDTSTANWHVKSLNNLTLPISEASLKEIIRANVIKEIFYPNNKQTMSVEFTLQTVTTDPVIESLELDINEQILKESDHQKVSKSFIWPSDKNSAETSVKIKKVSGETLNLVENGEWGLFKLLQHSNLSPIEDDSKNYQLILDVNGNSAKFLLSASSPLNPFVPELLSQFNLPHRLS